jgi:thiamine biosynthesis lipoprotein
MRLTRRKAVLGLAAFATAAVPVPRGEATVSRPATAFGTVVRLTVTGHDAAHANRCLNAGYEMIRSVERAFSLYRAESELSRLNAHGRLPSPSALMLELLKECDRMWRLTQGAFNPLVQPLWQAWAEASARRALPSNAEIEAARALTDWRKVRVSSSEVALPRGAALTFNGIARGYAADQVMRVLAGEGALAFVIDTGEFGVADRSRPHSFAIQDPRHRGRALGQIELRSGFAATSGDYETSFSPDFTHHHIFDPASGQSPRELAAVTVEGPSGTMTDGLSTAFMVLGVARSLHVLRRERNYGALFVLKSGDVIRSPQARW